MAKGKKKKKQIKQKKKFTKHYRESHHHKLGDEDEKLFYQQLISHGYKIIQIQADGNCLFTSINYNLYGKKDGMELRTQAVAFLKQYEEEYKLFIEDDENFDEYITKMSDSGEWGGQLEIIALSSIHKIRIVVHQYDQPRYEICHPSIKTNKEIHLSYHNG